MNAQSYTDEQVYQLIASMPFEMEHVARALDSINADRQRLQAEVETLRSELHDADDAYASILKELHSIKVGEQ